MTSTALQRRPHPRAADASRLPPPRSGGGSGRGHGPVHRFPVRVYYEDTDAAGIVYYANYLKFAERARSEWLREFAAAEEAEALRAVLFVVRRCTIDYLQPARLDDLLEVETGVTAWAGATLELRQTVRRGDVDLVRMQVTLVCLRAGGRPARLPAALRAALETVMHS